MISYYVLVYDCEIFSSQTCSLKYRFRALENFSRGMAGSTVGVKKHVNAYRQQETYLRGRTHLPC